MPLLLRDQVLVLEDFIWDSICLRLRGDIPLLSTLVPPRNRLLEASILPLPLLVRLTSISRISSLSFILYDFNITFSDWY